MDIIKKEDEEFK